MQGVRDRSERRASFGEVRTGSAERVPANALFVPPPVDLLEDALDDFEAFLHEDVRMPLLVRCALAHYSVRNDPSVPRRNGRLGRLLIVFYSSSERVLGQPLLYFSAYFERNRDEYVEALRQSAKAAISKDGLHSSSAAWPASPRPSSRRMRSFAFATSSGSASESSTHGASGRRGGGA